MKLDYRHLIDNLKYLDKSVCLVPFHYFISSNIKQALQSSYELLRLKLS